MSDLAKVDVLDLRTKTATELEALAGDYAHWGTSAWRMSTEALGELARRAEANEALREAAQKLVTRLDYVHEHPAYKGVWMNDYAHGGRYDGPTYFEEHNALRRLAYDDWRAARGALAPAKPAPDDRRREEWRQCCESVARRNYSNSGLDGVNNDLGALRNLVFALARHVGLEVP